MNSLLKGIGFGVGFGAAVVGAIAAIGYFYGAPEATTEEAPKTEEPVKPEEAVETPAE